MCTEKPKTKPKTKNKPKNQKTKITKKQNLTHFVVIFTLLLWSGMETVISLR